MQWPAVAISFGARSAPEQTWDTPAKSKVIPTANVLFFCSIPLRLACDGSALEIKSAEESASTEKRLSDRLRFSNDDYIL